ncbi:YdeI/OmpD-associated family protein [Tateyamaria omphalii]|uniref:YdeI/OmpD-associated family protein n=1 Tax=Tateyamaria omphalii TaxID=299262 RepID=UPI001C996B59|nr:YdeI/OmpD-associated family protein [Tateyamaria omphalii]MBY5934522.1 YdeI/OmpD-associated family protein [Tateyamaria omphalii]
MNDDWIWFEGVIEPLEWGKNTYTILRLPDDVTAALPPKTKRIEGEFGDFPINLALTKAPVLDGTFVYTGKTFLRDSGLEVGQPFEARIRPVDPNLVDVPEDVMAAIRSAGRSADWSGLTPGQQRAKLHLVNTAKRADTRAKRIAKLISEL